MNKTPTLSSTRSIKSIKKLILVLIFPFLAFPHPGYSQWDTIKKDGCSGWGKRQFSAKLLSNPFNNWRTTCEQSQIYINGANYHSNRCDDHGWGGMWGVWFIDDPTCAASWGTPSHSCVQQDLRTYSARLYDIPDGDWSGACKRTPMTVGGKHFATPTRCLDLGARGMWGAFDVVDSSCRARWSAWSKQACINTKQRYKARLENTQTNNWENECQSTRPVINGVSYEKPDRCYTSGTFAMYGMWGEIDIEDEQCRSYEESDENIRLQACLDGIDESLREAVKSCDWGGTCSPALVVLLMTASCHLSVGSGK